MTEYTDDERDHMAGLVLHFTELATLYGQVESTWSALAKRFDELGDSRNAAKARKRAAISSVFAAGHSRRADMLKDPAALDSFDL